MDLFKFGGKKEATSWDLFDYNISFSNRKQKRRLKNICKKKGRAYIKRISRAEMKSEI